MLTATCISHTPHFSFIPYQCLTTSSLPDQSNPPLTLPLALTNLHCNIISFNARSLLPKLDDLLSIVHLHSPDICKTWLHLDITYAELSFPGYTLFRKDHNRNGGGRVAIFALSSLSPFISALFSSFSLLHPNHY